MNIATADPVAPDQAMLPTTRGPQAGPKAAKPPSGRSFGFARLAPITASEPWDLTGIRYDAERGINVDLTGKPAVHSPNLGSTTQYTTTADHQSWTDSDTD